MLGPYEYQPRRPLALIDLTGATVASDFQTPAERVLRELGGPAYFEIGKVDPPSNSVSSFAPDDWRLYYLMRELPVADRIQVLHFAEMLYNLRHAMDWAVKAPIESPPE